jgi:hypothetical protein
MQISHLFFLIFYILNNHKTLNKKLKNLKYIYHNVTFKVSV